MFGIEDLMTLEQIGQARAAIKDLASQIQSATGVDTVLARRAARMILSKKNISEWHDFVVWDKHKPGSVAEGLAKVLSEYVWSEDDYGESVSRYPGYRIKTRKGYWNIPTLTPYYMRPIRLNWNKWQE